MDIHTRQVRACVCVCANVKKNWDKLKERLDDASDETTFNEFQKQSCHDSHGEVVKSKNEDSVKKLVPVNHQVSLSYITSLISAIMANIINHRNIRRIYRNTKKLFLHLLPCLYENRFFWEPHYWDQVTVHSGITKTSYEKKTYHSYISNSRERDKSFVSNAMKTVFGYKWKRWNTNNSQK